MKLELVPKWQTGWKWFSNWAFMLIVFLATVPLPPEVVAMLPPVIQKYLIAIVAVCGLVLRFVKQKPPTTGDGVLSDIVSADVLDATFEHLEDKHD